MAAINEVRREPAKSLGAMLCSLLYVIAGVAPEDVTRLDQRTRIQYATLGLAFALNLIILLAVWMKVGTRYLGWPGLFVPGIAVPCLFVLGLDRLVAMRHRRLSGELAGFNLPEGNPRRSETVFRIAMALSFSVLTTLTFMLDQASSPIRVKQDDVSRMKNRPLHEEMTQRVLTSYDQRRTELDARSKQHQLDRESLQKQIESVNQQMAEVQGRARIARDQAAMEAGGLDQRVLGTGPRFRAQLAMAMQNEQSAAQLQASQRNLIAQRQAIDKSAAELAVALNTALMGRNRGLANVDIDMQDDLRFQQPKRGLFADATAFVALYSEPGEAAGMWIFTLALFPVLLAIECAALLALSINPSSPLDVLRMAENRALASRLVGDAEIAMARSQSRGAPIEIVIEPEPPIEQAHAGAQAERAGGH